MNLESQSIHKPGASEPGYQIAGIPGAKLIDWMPMYANVTLLATAAMSKATFGFSENKLPIGP